MAQIIRWGIPKGKHRAKVRRCKLQNYRGLVCTLQNFRAGSRIPITFGRVNDRIPTGCTASSGGTRQAKGELNQCASPERSAETIEKNLLMKTNSIKMLFAVGTAGFTTLAAATVLADDPPTAKTDKSCTGMITAVDPQEQAVMVKSWWLEPPGGSIWGIIALLPFLIKIPVRSMTCARAKKSK